MLDGIASSKIELNNFQKLVVRSVATCYLSRRIQWKTFDFREAGQVLTFNSFFLHLVSFMSWKHSRNSLLFVLSHSLTNKSNILEQPLQNIEIFLPSTTSDTSRSQIGGPYLLRYQCRTEAVRIISYQLVYLYLAIQILVLIKLVIKDLLDKMRCGVQKTVHKLR